MIHSLHNETWKLNESKEERNDFGLSVKLRCHYKWKVNRILFWEKMSQNGVKENGTGFFF